MGIEGQSEYKSEEERQAAEQFNQNETPSPEPEIPSNIAVGAEVKARDKLRYVSGGWFVENIIHGEGDAILVEVGRDNIIDGRGTVQHVKESIPLQELVNLNPISTRAETRSVSHEQTPLNISESLTGDEKKFAEYIEKRNQLSQNLAKIQELVPPEKYKAVTDSFNDLAIFVHGHYDESVDDSRQSDIENGIIERKKHQEPSQ